MMRCDEVVLELAAPTADRDRAAMADHLADCPACAEWARRAEGLDRLWGATRPAEPPPAAWDAVWAKIAQAVPAVASARPGAPPVAGAVPSRNGSGPNVLVHPGPDPAPMPARIRGRGWGLAAVALVGLAQAAAVLVALGLAWRAEPRPDGPRQPATALVEQPKPAVPVAVRSAKPVEMSADIDGNALIVIAVGPQSAKVEDRTPPEMFVSSDIGMVITNEMEWIAAPRVAAQ